MSAAGAGALGPPPQPGGGARGPLAADPVAYVRDALADSGGWLVGGAVRDRLLGRPARDLDLVVPGDPARAARTLARALDAPAFRLSERFGAWRVVVQREGWQADVSPLAGSIEEDLARRDLTINAIGERLDDGALVDPHDGRGDLARGRLRAVSRGAFADDPLRVLRLARLACELELVPEPATRSAAQRAAPALTRVAAERVFAELRGIVAGPRPRQGLEEMDVLGAAAIVLPELVALRGVGQGVYHHLDVYDHTLAVLDNVVALEREPERWLGDQAEGVRALLAEPLADELTRGGALRLGALLHDIAKPHTRRCSPDGRVGFPGHDRLGAEMTIDILARLRTSVRLREHVAGLARHHLRLGFLVHERPISRRAVYRYLVACRPAGADVTLLTVADRLATRGRKATEAIARHLELARELLAEALRLRAARPLAPLVRGDELAALVGRSPGPWLGEVLAELEEARFAGEVCTREQALARARALVEGG